MAAQGRVDRQALVSQLMGDLATVLGALLGAAGDAAAEPGPFAPAWFVPASLSGSASGTVGLAMAAEDASALAKLVLGFDDEPDEQAIVDMLQEVAGQAFGALSQHAVAQGLSFKVLSPRREEGSGATNDCATFRFALTDSFRPLVGCWVDIDEAVAVAAASAPTGGVAATTAPAGSPSHLPANLDVILDIDLPLSVRFGETEMSLDSLTKLGPGSMIDLGRSPDDPVEVLVNGRLVARAEVVVVAGNYGVRILEILSAADRLRTLNA